ncbi:hypothetical protein AC579_9375 [Pseudocercospora musae]|uniref:Uncharacterized protein n=1 Tax=Pseudocercospora musae TaxID=113226 RepID=A0A139IEQ4_9PEZI|nr:hypothetical protein AC579_9375 [Pseudocercospora musae]
MSSNNYYYNCYSDNGLRLRYRHGHATVYSTSTSTIYYRKRDVSTSSGTLSATASDLYGTQSVSDDSQTATCPPVKTVYTTTTVASTTVTATADLPRSILTVSAVTTAVIVTRYLPLAQPLRRLQNIPPTTSDMPESSSPSLNSTPEASEPTQAADTTSAVDTAPTQQPALTSTFPASELPDVSPSETIPAPPVTTSIPQLSTYTSTPAIPSARAPYVAQTVAVYLPSMAPNSTDIGSYILSGLNPSQTTTGTPSPEPYTGAADKSHAIDRRGLFGAARVGILLLVG